MSATPDPSRTHPATIHASAVLIGAGAILIHGPSGAGKSQLAFRLIAAAQAGRFGAAARFARLISDDRIILSAHHGRLIARAVAELAGLIEIRGLGIRQVPYERAGLVRLIVELNSVETNRLPAPASASIAIDGIEIPRICVGSGQDPLIPIAAFLTSADTKN